MSAELGHSPSVEKDSVIVCLLVMHHKLDLSFCTLSLTKPSWFKSVWSCRRSCIGYTQYVYFGRCHRHICRRMSATTWRHEAHRLSSHVGGREKVEPCPGHLLSAGYSLRDLVNRCIFTLLSQSHKPESQEMTYFQVSHITR